MKKKFFFIAVLSILILPDPAFSQNPGDSTQKVIAHNLGPDINSGAIDFGAYEERDGLTLYFVSRRTSHASHVDQFWFVNRPSIESPWSKPEYLKSLNNYDHPAGGICRDDSGKIYFSTIKESSPEPNDMDIWEGSILGVALKVNPLPRPINTIKWESQPSVTSDGKDLYFVTNRENYRPKGGVDIFHAHKNPDNGWSMPVKLGEKINFGVFNGTPYISPDGAFLFYTSSGESNSRRKIYMASRTGPKDDDWSDPVLLPAEINSDDADDMFPMVARDGKTIYFSSNRSGGYGDFDIYKAQLPVDIQAKIAKSFLK
ncbi:MAG: TolB family protein [Candidatus Kapaibacterium sp.]